MNATSERLDAPVLVPGKTCWRIERADRLRLVIDAEDYFRHAKQAMLKARHSIILIGWDFDTRILLEPKGSTLDGPNKLGRFLDWLAKTRPDLHIYVLKWDLTVLQTLFRGSMPLKLLDLISHKRISFELDGHHPVGAAHHQKIIVIDDAMAFCGGIDMTSGRWDTRDHLDEDRGRRSPWGRPMGPWHDAATLVDGAAARALSELARTRWEEAGREPIPPAPAGSDPWPDDLDPTVTDVDVAIARTLPLMDDRAEVREIEALYLAGIAAARRTLYLESQYFASRRIAEAIARRLAEPDGPEVVVVNPREAEGWLEQAAMDTARRRLLAMVRAADSGGRFAIYFPVTQSGEPIYVHAKAMVVDDRLLRIGSSNLNNRSMGFDTECDLAIEATGDDGGRLGEVIAGVRNDLLAEHLDVERAEVEARIEAEGSLIGAIEALRHEGRSLRPLPPEENGAIEDALAENELLDPERPPKFWRRIARRTRWA